jgi:translation initiation factor 3 subunit M
MYRHTSNQLISGLMNGVRQMTNECKSGKPSLLWLRRQKTGITQDDAYSSELYNLLISAISVLPASETNSLIIKAIAAAIAIPNVFNVQALLSLPAMARLQADKNPAYDFLQVFLTGDLETYRTFVKSNPSFLADNRTSSCIISNTDIDESKAERKIRLLTLSSLSNTPSRTLSYAKIASSLDIPQEDVELWLIDVIRAGLVEGKLSQARQELLVHRSTYRTFGRAEWENLYSRLEDWKVALEGVLASDQVSVLREQETQPVTNGTTAGQEVTT